ncbi:hypothetical protein K456DRAFT_571582 [Colletotrichum gloeosporioides 23]|nr:hypothetical protein K456DRAFT_571582 [Colletotrichum gloeosporioides 23]
MPNPKSQSLAFHCLSPVPAWGASVAVCPGKCFGAAWFELPDGCQESRHQHSLQRDEMKKTKVHRSTCGGRDKTGNQSRPRQCGNGNATVQRRGLRRHRAKASDHSSTSNRRHAVRHVPRNANTASTGAF